MHSEQIHVWQHPHSFGQELRRTAETRTRWVILITAVMMLVEIVAGVAYGSMALLADGLHMASHTAALGLNVFAYAYARRHAGNPGFSFGTGKVNALGGFSGAVLLLMIAVLMAFGSIERLVSPITIAVDQALLVAVAGLIVNGISALLLRHEPHAEEDHDHEALHHHHDHNLAAAYLHVITDALTSVLAIAGLLVAKYYGAYWMDPVIGLVGAGLVAWWSVGLIRRTSAVLLDKQAPEAVRAAVKASIEAHDDNRISDLHVWSIGPGIYAAIISLVTHEVRSPESYKRLLPVELGIRHVTIEVHRCPQTTATCR